MTKEEIINDINKIIQEITDILDESDLLDFKNELLKMQIGIKCIIELKEKLGGKDHD